MEAPRAVASPPSANKGAKASTSAAANAPQHSQAAEGGAAGTRKRSRKAPKDAKKSGDAAATAGGSEAAATAAAPTKKRATRKKKAKQKVAVKKKEQSGGGGGGRRDDDNADAGPRIKLKVVVRRLPPNLPEGIFWKAISPFARKMDNTEGGTTAAVFERAYFVAGKLKDGSRRGIQADSDASPHTYSRAYLRFQTAEGLVAFHRQFDGHLFRDAKGNEHNAVVEFAPFQKMPDEVVTARRKRGGGGGGGSGVDALQGTIEDDAEYKQFLSVMQEADEEATKAGGGTQAEKTDVQLMAHLTSMAAEASSARKEAKSTPLLEHLRALRTAKAEASALKNARNYLNKNSVAYAATTGSGGKAGGASSLRKGKAKAKAAVPAKEAGAIPTGPKAMQKKEQAKTKKPKKTAGAGEEGAKTSIAASSASTPVEKAKRERRRGGKGGGASAAAGGGGPTGEAAPPSTTSAVAILKRDEPSGAANAGAANTKQSVPAGTGVHASGGAAKSTSRAQRGRGADAGGPRGSRSTTETAAVPPAATQ